MLSRHAVFVTLKQTAKRLRVQAVRRAMTQAAAQTATKLLYFEDTYLVQKSGACVLSVESSAEDGKTAVVLNETIFYPFGGGQPNDIGSIEGAGVRFDVTDVRSKDGVVYHYGSFASGSGASFSPGAPVSLAIDEARRRLHARVHSAGHLLDVCMARIGLGPERLVPTKGQHYTDVAYVEYKARHAAARIGAPESGVLSLPPVQIQGKVSAEEQASLQGALQKELDAAIAAGSKVSASLLPYAEATAACGGELPPYIAKDSTPRVVVVVNGSAGCPCGGTHVADVAEIRSMKITGVRVKKGVTRVSYTIDGMTAPAAGSEGAD